MLCKHADSHRIQCVARKVVQNIHSQRPPAAAGPVFCNRHPFSSHIRIRPGRRASNNLIVFYHIIRAPRRKHPCGKNLLFSHVFTKPAHRGRAAVSTGRARISFPFPPCSPVQGRRAPCGAASRTFCTARLLHAERATACRKGCHGPSFYIPGTGRLFTLVSLHTAPQMRGRAF